ncbi:MAG: hypothetical protein Q9220_002816 [cf. Caloplaca sp. 1 TL-2023]
MRYRYQIQVALDLGKEPLGAAINSAKQGIASPNGFRAWYKNNGAIGPVTRMLKNIQLLKPIRGLKPSRFSASQPEFVCVKQDTVDRFPHLTGDPYAQCERSGNFAMVLRGFKYVFLCEKFFTLKIAPIGPPTRNCPRVVNNEFERTGYRLADYQKYVLIHEMVHFYLGQSSLGFDTDPQEMYYLNQCVNLDAKDSLDNPMNYQYFVASEFSLAGFYTAVLMKGSVVEQGCTDAPDPFQPPFPLSSEALQGESKNHTSPGPVDMY